MESGITAIILTFNEEMHLERCLKSIKPFCKAIHIVDSFSTDRTLEIAAAYGAKVIQNPWHNYAAQFNFGLNNTNITTDWVMRMDADEYAEPGLGEELTSVLPTLQPNITGIMITRKVFFMGKWIKSFPHHMVRIWRTGKGHIEERWVDEHILLSEGTHIPIKSRIVDDNLNNIEWWTNKHNIYARREAFDLLNIKYKLFSAHTHQNQIGEDNRKKRWLKEKIYSNLPFGLRPLLYYLFRLFIKGGIFDGKQGFIFHTLQAFWYRFLVDVKVLEIETYMAKNKCNPQKAILDIYNIDVSKVMK